MSTLRKVFVAAVTAAALALSACGSDAENDTSGGAIDSALKEEAAAAIAELTAEPSARELEPLGKTPPKDVHVAMITCPVPACTQSADEVDQATKLLGWKLDRIVNEFTPESFASAFDSALQLDPDFIYYIATQPEDTVADQMAEAKARGIPVVANSPGPDTVIGGDSPIVAATSNTKAATTTVGKLVAQVIIADADSLDDIALMYDPSAPAYLTFVESFTKTITDAGGSIDEFEINQQDVGTSLPGQVVSYLQRKPDTEYFVAAHDDQLIGVPDAISGAGIESPKIIGQTPGAHTLEFLKAGTQYASVKPDAFGGHWDAIDLMARLSIGEELKDNEPVGNMMIAMQQNVDNVPAGVFKGVPDTYAEAWGVK